MIWISFVLIYSILKGLREIAKKKAMDKNSVMEVLVAYTLLSFVFVLPQAPKAGGLEAKFFVLIAIKSFAIFLAWICGFNSLKKLPVSLYGIIDLSRVLFATSFGIFFLGERLGALQILALAVVCAGLLLLKFRPPFLKKNSIESNEQVLQSESGTKTHVYIILSLASCLLNAFSGFLDKVLMKDITSSQLQFWYMLFLCLYYAIYMVATRTKFSFSVWKNKWIWILAIMFIIGDKVLFIANGIPESKVTIMTLIKQSSCLITILGGYFVFKEKDIAYRLFCATVVIAGILLGMVRI